MQYTRQSVFSIPFRVEPPQPGMPVPAQVRLHYSSDEGQSWQVYGDAGPGQNRFVFRTDRDGVYWFCVRTLDAAGREYPAGALSPELRVVVDTLPPRLDLEVIRNASGELAAQWRVLDRYLDPESLTLQYRDERGGDWQEIALERPSSDPSRRIETGDVAWWPEGSGGTVLVRGEVRDRAGNPAVTQARVDLGAAPSMGAQMLPARHTSSSRHPDMIWEPDSTSSEPFGAAPPPEEIPAPPPSRRDADGVAALPVSETSTFTERVEPLPAPDDSDGWPAREESETGVSSWPPSGFNPHESWPATDETSTAGDSPTSSAGPDLNATLTFAGWPSQPRPRLLNSLEFELDYEIEEVGASGVRRVEVWVTVDGGQSWSLLSTDNDNRSPALVRLPREGFYGFSLVIESARGIASLPPRGGDEPELIVGIDRTAPQVQLLSALQGLADHAEELTINWRAQDAWLEDRPVSIAYSTQPTGPWTEIASEIENSGTFVWRVDPSVPDVIYLQLDARDQAGNVQTVRTNQPVQLERVRPRGRIRDVRPHRS